MRVARLRLFANLRELAGTGSVDIDADTVGDLLTQAGSTYGPSFVAALDTAKVWVNGEPASAAEAVRPGDEVAVIPPVSGGAATIIDNPLLAPVGVVGSAILISVANAYLSVAWFAAAVVLVLALWAVDIVRQTNSGGMAMQLPPVLIGIMAGTAFVVASPGDTRGFEAFGLVMVVSLIVSLVWSVAVGEARHLSAVASTTVMTTMAGLAAASMMAARLVGGSTVLGVFLVQVIVAAVATGVAFRVAILDPSIVGSLGAIIAGVIAASLWGLPIVEFVLVGVAVALALLAGKGFGGLCRTGEPYVIDRPPGILGDLDGAVLAAGIMLPIFLLVTAA